MRRFELRDGTSNKFWEIALEGKSFSVRFGRIGTEGQVQSKSFPSADKARAEHDKLVAEKLKKGYVEQSKTKAKAEASPAAKSPPKGKVSLLERLDAWFAAHRPDHLKGLRKGATDADIDKVEKALGVRLPPGLRGFFRWRNGDAGDAKGRFQENWDAMSLAEVKEAHAAMTELLDAGDFDQPGWWSRAWVPFLSNGGGDHLCVDTQTGEVVELWHDDDRRSVLYPSFEAWLEVFVTTLEEGAWKLDGAGFFEPQKKALDRAMQAVCPGFPRKRRAGDASFAPAKKAAPATAKAAPSPGGAPNMDEKNARRLMAAFMGAGAAPPKKIGKGFYAGGEGSKKELEFDPASRTLIARYGTFRYMPTKKPNAAVAKVLEEESRTQAALLGGGRLEVHLVRAFSKDPEFNYPMYVLRRDFGDPEVADADFVAAVRAMVESARKWESKRSQELAAAVWKTLNP